MGSQCNALTQLAHCTRRSKRIRRRLIMDGRRLLLLLLCVLQLSRLVRSTVLEGGWIVKDETGGQPVLFLGHGGDNRCHIGRAKNTLCKLTKSTPKMKKKTLGELAIGDRAHPCGGVACLPWPCLEAAVEQEGRCGGRFGARCKWG